MTSLHPAPPAVHRPADADTASWPAWTDQRWTVADDAPFADFDADDPDPTDPIWDEWALEAEARAAESECR